MAPTIEIDVRTLLTPEAFEKLEKSLAELFNREGIVADFLDNITGNEWESYGIIQDEEPPVVPPKDAECAGWEFEKARKTNQEVHSIHCPAYTTPALRERGHKPEECNCKAPQDDPIIQLYSPYAFHSTQAIVVNDSGRRLLIELLNSPGEIITAEPAFLSDGEGGTIGIIKVGEDEWNKRPKYRLPYTADYAQGESEDKIDPEVVIEKKAALDKKEGDE
jgi:hypothetical protein